MVVAVLGGDLLVSENGLLSSLLTRLLDEPLLSSASQVMHVEWNCGFNIMRHFRVALHSRVVLGCKQEQCLFQFFILDVSSRIRRVF